MTARKPADLADTVRDALDVLYHFTSDAANPPGEGRSWHRANGRSALDALQAQAEAAKVERDRWLAWSGGDYPDDSRGDVIAAYADGTIVLDDGITTWNPKRACEWFAARAALSAREEGADTR